MVLQTRAYFEALPSSKAPIRGTPGERYRQKQLIRQVPAHDIDMLYCNNLSLEEKKQMEIFLRMRKEKSLGMLRGMLVWRVEQAMVDVHTVEPPIKTTTSEQRTSCHSFP